MVGKYEKSIFSAIKTIICLEEQKICMCNSEHIMILNSHFVLTESVNLVLYRLMAVYVGQLPLSRDLFEYGRYTQ